MQTPLARDRPADAQERGEDAPRRRRALLAHGATHSANVTVKQVVRRGLAVLGAVCDVVERERLHCGERLTTARAIGEHTRQCGDLRDEATVRLAL